MADNDDFVQSIRDATAKIALDMEKKVSQACLVVEGEARQLCPVDQGHLRRRSQVRRKSQQTKLSAGLGVIWNMPPMCTTVQEFTL